MAKKIVSEVFTAVDHTVTAVAKETDKTLNPVRRSVLRRFPILFLLLTTFGVVATFYGFERMLLEWTYVNDRPWLILFIGVAVLYVTGTLYKKLD